jgi:hypothetical protein
MKIVVLGSSIQLLFYIISLLVPWSLLYLPISGSSWDIIVPVKIGLIRCFGSNFCILDHKGTIVEGTYFHFATDLRDKFEIIYIIVFILYTSSTCLSIGSLYIAIFQKEYFIYLHYLYPISVFQDMLSVILYFPFTMWYLNGGEFLQGALLLLFSTLIGMGCTIIYVVENRIQKTQQYTAIS